MQEKMCDRDAVCPYFISHMKQSIHCEGPIPDSRVTVTFENEKKKELHYQVFCCRRCAFCEMYQAAQKKYEEE